MFFSQLFANLATVFRQKKRMSEKVIVRRQTSILVSLVLLLGLTLPPLVEAQPSRKLEDDRVTELLTEGRKLVDAGNLPDAIAIYQQAAALDSTNPRIFSGIGVLQAKSRTLS